MSDYQNENLNIKLERLPGSKVKLEISISPKASEAAYEKAVKNINKEITIPGFRKGKAPKNLMIEKFNSQIQEEWRSVLLNTAFQEALALVKVYPLFQNSVKPEIKKISKEDGSEITLSYEAKPEVPEIVPADLVIKNVEVKPVTEKEIQERIYELQLNQAKWNDIEDRGIQEGDFVTLDIESLDNPGVNICKNQMFRALKGQLGDWLYNLLMDKKANDTFEALSEKEPCKSCDEDETHVHQEEPEFIPTKLQIHIKSVRTPILPEIDEEFVKKLGAESIEAFQERVVSSLEKNAKDEAQQKRRDLIEKEILKKYPFDIPSSMIKNGEDSISEEAAQSLSDSYRMFFIAQKLAHELKLDISQDELMEEFMIQAYMTNPKDSFINPGDDPKEIQHRIKSYLIDKKVKDYLIEHAHQE